MNLNKLKSFYENAANPTEVTVDKSNITLINPIENKYSITINNKKYPLLWINNVPYLQIVQAIIIYKNSYIILDGSNENKKLPLFIKKNREKMYVEINEKYISNEKVEYIIISDDEVNGKIDYDYFPDLMNVVYIDRYRGEKTIENTIVTKVIFKLFQKSENTNPESKYLYSIIDEYRYFPNDVKIMLKGYFAKEDPQMNNLLITKDNIEAHGERVYEENDGTNKNEDEKPSPEEIANDNGVDLLHEADEPGLGKEIEKLEKDVDDVEDKDNEEKKEKEKENEDFDAGLDDDTESNTSNEDNNENSDSNDDSNNGNIDSSNYDEDSNIDTSSDSEDNKIIVKKNTIINLSNLDRALADRELFSNYNNLYHRLEAFNKNLSILRLKIEDSVFENISDEIDSLIKTLDDYINFKLNTNNYEGNLTNYLLFTKAFNNIVININQRVEE